MTAATSHGYAVPSLAEARATLADALHAGVEELIAACAVIEDQSDDPAEAREACELRERLQAKAPRPRRYPGRRRW
ncbi:hypothetical protein [Salipiger marinus]|uniref:Uncharacterized protein n=1 Tax=Salipiger marinus TaxID=555512 RepID=A0A1G8T5K4_9RHOB|nr:hypothetical protein [Salipiger marinus]SDJ36889.1 hypothetical protein SAMN04487993_102811 [Salipiger marinus]